MIRTRLQSLARLAAKIETKRKRNHTDWPSGPGNCSGWPPVQADRVTQHLIQGRHSGRLVAANETCCGVGRFSLRHVALVIRDRQFRPQLAQLAKIRLHHAGTANFPDHIPDGLSGRLTQLAGIATISRAPWQNRRLAVRRVVWHNDREDSRVLNELRIVTSLFLARGVYRFLESNLSPRCRPDTKSVFFPKIVMPGAKPARGFARQELNESAGKSVARNPTVQQPEQVVATPAEQQQPGCQKSRMPVRQWLSQPGSGISNSTNAALIRHGFRLTGGMMAGFGIHGGTRRWE